MLFDTMRLYSKVFLYFPVHGGSKLINYSTQYSCVVFSLTFSLRENTYTLVQAVKSISVLFEHRIFPDHACCITGKNLLWVELHESCTAQNTLKYRSSMSTLGESDSFHEIHRIRCVRTELKLTVLYHISLPPG